jgi:Na+/glutamate symporter
MRNGSPVTPVTSPWTRFRTTFASNSVGLVMLSLTGAPTSRWGTSRVKTDNDNEAKYLMAIRRAGKS